MIQFFIKALIISLSLKKYQLLKFIFYEKYNAKLYKLVKDSIFNKGDISII